MVRNGREFGILINFWKLLMIMKKKLNKIKFFAHRWFFSAASLLTTSWTPKYIGLYRLFFNWCTSGTWFPWICHHIWGPFVLSWFFLMQSRDTHQSARGFADYQWSTFRKFIGSFCWGLRWGLWFICVRFIGFVFIWACSGGWEVGCFCSTFSIFFIIINTSISLLKKLSNINKQKKRKKNKKRTKNEHWYTQKNNIKPNLIPLTLTHASLQLYHSGTSLLIL